MTSEVTLPEDAVEGSEVSGVARPTGHRLRRAVTSHLYLPAVAVVGTAVALIVFGWSREFGGAGFASTVTDLRITVVGPISAGLIGVFLIAERVRPAQRRPLIARGHRQDLIYAVVNAALVMPLVAALSLSFSYVARTELPWIVLPKHDVWPRWTVVTALFVAMDFCNWFAHLANHRVRLLWRFHELHHSQEDMNVLTVFRTHPLIHVSYLVALIPAIVLLANGSLTTMMLVVYAGIVAFAHSNTNMGFGPLERVLVSPNFHRIHHRLDGPQDVNLGFALTVWDQLFHTVVWPTPATIRIDTGIPGRPLIVEQAGERPRHFAVFAAQLVAPFRPWDERADAPVLLHDVARPRLPDGLPSDAVPQDASPRGDDQDSEVT